MIDKRRVVILAVLTLVLSGALFVYLSRESSVTNINRISNFFKKKNQTSIADEKKLSSGFAEPHAHQHEHEESSSAKNVSTRETIVFNYNEEASKIRELKTKYPKSKPQLLQSITAPDRFHEKNIPVLPHTSDEILQRQMGAIKVFALKVLLESEKNKSMLLNDLDQIIRTAQDPTLKEIARAARTSVESDRPFIQDQVDAISNLKE